MVEFDLESAAEQRNFWFLSLIFLYLAAALQFSFGERLLGITTLGMAVTLTAVAHQKLKDKA